MNAVSNAEHLQLIRPSFPDGPILLFWDRAPWHRRSPIQAVWSANPRLEIVDFPVAAPDLNSQAQVWKPTRRVGSHHHLIPKLPQLADNSERHLKLNTFHSPFLHDDGYFLVCPFLNRMPTSQWMSKR